MQETYHNIQQVKVYSKTQSNLENKEYPFFNCANNIDHKSIAQITKNIKHNFKKTIVIGCGGSINAGIAYSSLYKNNIIFIDNIDPEVIQTLTDNILNYKEYYFIFISKSGKSEEVLLLHKIFREKLTAQKLNPTNNFLIITQINNNPLHEIAKQYQYQTIKHAENIGGRFSYLSITGMIVASIANCNLQNIQQGANDAICNYLNSPNEKNNFCKILATNLLNKTLHTNVNMIYNDKLLNYNIWLQQLWAESLGKDNLGSIMLGFSGTRDQHSQLQLFLANPEGKAFNIITCNNFNSSFNQLKSAYAHHAKSVLNNLAKTGSIVKQQTIEALNEYTLTYIMTSSIIDVLLCAEFMNIDPFCQDQVEAIKIANFIKN